MAWTGDLKNAGKSSQAAQSSSALIWRRKFKLARSIAFWWAVLPIVIAKGPVDASWESIGLAYLFWTAPLVLWAFFSLGSGVGVAAGAIGFPVIFGTFGSFIMVPIIASLLDARQRTPRCDQAQAERCKPAGAVPSSPRRLPPLAS